MSELTRPARIYLSSVIVLGAGFLAATLVVDRSGFSDSTVLELFGLLVLFAFLGAMSPITTSSGAHLSINFPPLLAAVLTLPTGFAALAACIAGDPRLPRQGYPWYRFVFNRAMFALVYGCGSLAFQSLKDLTPAGTNGHALTVVSAGIIAVIVIAALNSPLVIAAVALTTGQPFGRVTYQTLQGVLLSYAGMAPLGALMAYLVNSGQLVGVIMGGFVLLLLVIYRELSRRALKGERVARGSYLAQSRLIDKKDRSTFGHSERVGVLAEATATKMNVPIDLVEEIRIGATLHDLGKIAIPDAILHKEGKLTDEEWVIMKSHCVEGWDVLAEQEVLHEAARIVRSHHENYDGSGYPDGLKGRSIPVGGRITRVVDSFDCVTNVRDYRAWVKDPFEALSELHSMGGTTYDPEVVEAFTQVMIERDPALAAAFSDAGQLGRPSPWRALARPAFLKLWLAQGLSNFGDMLTTTGLALGVYALSHSTLAVGAIFITRAIPNLLLGLVAGQVADRYDRKSLMLIMDVLRALLIIAVPFLIHGNFVLLLVVVFVVSTATVIFSPARAAVMPDLLPAHLLQAGNSAMALAERGTEILGYLAAGLIIALSGIPLVFAIDALTFLVSAGLIIGIGFPEMVMTREGGGWAQVRRDILSGLQQIRQTAELRVIFPFSFFMVAAGSALLPLMVPLAVDHLHAGNTGFAMLEASIAVGASLGALLTGFLRSSRRGVLMVAGGIGMGFATVLAGLSPALPIAMIFFIAAGVANMVYLIPMITAIQEVTEVEVRGRVFAARFTIVQMGILVGTAYASVAAAELTGGLVGIAVVVSGLLMILVSAAAAVSPELRRV